MAVPHLGHDTTAFTNLEKCDQGKGISIFVKRILVNLACGFFLVMSSACASTQSSEVAGKELEANATSIPEDIVVAYWNTWFTPHLSGEPAEVLELRVGQTYDLILDLSPYQYGQPGIESVRPDREFMEYLNQQRHDFIIRVFPVVAGRGLDLLPSDIAMRPLPITMERLRRPRVRVSPEEPLAEFSQRVRSGHVVIGVKATQAGCAAVGFSIWNRELDRPLDHIVRTVSVVGSTGPRPACNRESGKSLKGSLLSLLNQTPNRLANVALHIFEMKVGEEVYSNAVFVDRANGTPLVHSWSLSSQPSKLFSDKSFLKALEDARSEKDYEYVSQKVTDRIFSTENDEGRRAAKAALHSLTQLATQSQQPMFFARLVDVQGLNLFLPLGLLSVGGDLLGKTTHVLQPLPRETYSQPDQCIASWTMVLPQDLGDKDVEAKLERPVDIHGRRIATYEEFESYAGERTVPTQPEGLLLLSHHGDGNVWFERPGKYVSSSDLTRRFAPGSVAVLAACDVAKLTDSGNHEALALVRALNNKNVDAVVLSPFNIPTEVGITFAQVFANEVTKAYRASETPDLAELFSRTVRSAVGDSSLIDLVSEDTFQEFFIAGNGGLRLCPPQGGRHALPQTH